MENYNESMRSNGGSDVPVMLNMEDGGNPWDHIKPAKSAPETVDSTEGNKTSKKTSKKKQKDHHCWELFEEQDETCECEDETASGISNLLDSVGGLFHWRSLFCKTFWIPMLLYYIFYVAIALVYNYGVTNQVDRDNFHVFSREMVNISKNMPITFMLSLLTGLAANRMYAVTSNMPTTGRVIATFAGSLKSDVPGGQELVDRYTRYVLLMWIMTFLPVSIPLRKKFPTFESLEGKGFIQTAAEKSELDEVLKSGSRTKSCMSLAVADWLEQIVVEAAERNQFKSGSSDFKSNIDQIHNMKKMCQGISRLTQPVRSPPLIMVQSVSVLTHLYGFLSILGHVSFIVTEPIANARVMANILTSYLPNGMAISYLCFYSWLKVAVILAHPFGDKEDNIDIPAALNRHVERASHLRLRYRPRNIITAQPTSAGQINGSSQV